MPNARFQARRRAGARHERTLFAVACKPLLGGWRPTQVPGPPGDRLPPRPVGRGLWRLPRRRAPGSRARGPTVPWTTARQYHAPRCWPGPAGGRRCRRPCPPPLDPAARPHVRDDTPPRLRPPAWGRDTGHSGACRDQRGPKPDTSRTAAGAESHHDGPARLKMPALHPQPAQAHRAGGGTGRPPSGATPDTGLGTGGHGGAWPGSSSFLGHARQQHCAQQPNVKAQRRERERASAAAPG